MRQMWREIEKNDNSWPFRDPVDLQEVPDYTKVVAHPIGAWHKRAGVPAVHNPRQLFVST